MSTTTTNLTTLKINHLTQAQYDAAVENNQINENEIYMTPISIDGGGIEDVEVDGVSVVSNGVAEIDLTSYAKSVDVPTAASDIGAMDSSDYTSETWTFTLSDNTTVTKKVVVET